MTTIRAALPILMFAYACSSSGGGTDGTNDPGGGDPPGGDLGPATVTEYCDQYWGAYAARWAACEHGSAAQAAALFSSGPRCADPIQAVTAGRATYAPPRAGACLSFIETASCDVLQAFMSGMYAQADCEAAIAGNVADAETCYSNESCASGVCVGPPNACPGSCVTPIPAGSPCDTFRPCAVGTACNVLLATPACAPLSPLDGRCMNDSWCAAGLFCEQITFYEAVCHARKTSGSCYGDGECAIGYRCAGSTCVPWLAAGEACTQGENGCGPGLWCGVGGTCIDGAKPSWSCAAVNGEHVPCIGGTCASRVSGNVCTAWLAPGGACSLQSQCAPTDVCDTSGTGQCTTLCGEP